MDKEAPQAYAEDLISKGDRPAGKATIAIIITNVLGGGTPRHAWEMVKVWSGQGHTVVMVQEMDRLLVISVYSKDGCVRQLRFFEDEQLNKLVEVLQTYHVSLLHVEHLLDANPAFLTLHKRLQVPFVITLHDYYTLCPYIKLTDEHDTYCGEKGAAVCDACIARRHFFSRTLKRELTSISEWRRFWERYLEEAAFVVVPSEDMKQRVLSYYPELDIHMVEDPELITPAHKVRRIGLIGSLSVAKGAGKVKECLTWCVSHQVAVHFTLFGTLSDVTLTKEEQKYITVLGAYQEEEIYELIRRHDIDFFWFPGVLPETYSYTLSIPIRLHISCISTDLGAIASRITTHHWGEIYPWRAGAEEILHHLMHFPFEQYANPDFTISNTTFGKFEDFYKGITVPSRPAEKAPSAATYPVQVTDSDFLFNHLPSVLTRAEFNTLWPGASFSQKQKLLAHVDKAWLKHVIQEKGMKYFIKKIKSKAFN